MGVLTSMRVQLGLVLREATYLLPAASLEKIEVLSQRTKRVSLSYKTMTASPIFQVH
jgi:hypothetical protein